MAKVWHGGTSPHLAACILQESTPHRVYLLGIGACRMRYGFECCVFAVYSLCTRCVLAVYSLCTRCVLAVYSLLETLFDCDDFNLFFCSFLFCFCGRTNHRCNHFEPFKSLQPRLLFCLINAVGMGIIFTIKRSWLLERCGFYGTCTAPKKRNGRTFNF